MKLSILTPVVIAAVVAARVVAAEELKSVDAIFAYSTQKAQGYKSFTADFSQSVNMMGAAMKFNGQMSFQQPALMRMELEMPIMGQQQRMLVIMDAQGMMWQELGTGATARVMKVDMRKIAASSPSGFNDPFKDFDPNRKWAQSREKFDYKLVGTTNVHDEPVYILEGEPKPGAKWSQQEAFVAGMFGKSKAFIGQRDGFLHKMEQYGKDGTNLLVGMEFTNIKFNTNLPAATFVYQPAPDANVMDLTAITQQMMGGAKPTNEPAATPPPTGQPAAP